MLIFLIPLWDYIICDCLGVIRHLYMWACASVHGYTLCRYCGTHTHTDSSGDAADPCWYTDLLIMCSHFMFVWPWKGHLLFTLWQRSLMSIVYVTCKWHFFVQCLSSLTEICNKPTNKWYRSERNPSWLICLAVTLNQF